MKRFSVVLAAVAFCTLMAADASAQANFALRGIGLKAGVVNPEDLDTTLGLGLIFDLGTIHPDWAFESYAGYWSQTEEDFGGEFGVRDFSFGAKTKYMFKTSNPAVQPFAGGGLGLHVLSAHAEIDPISVGGTVIFPGSSVEETELRVGLDLGGGLRYDAGKQFAFLGEGWFSVVSDASHFSLMVGAVYMFGR
ncbi:MAG TPA: outer membrane beta-barrel protein [Candidatus Krumholzibacteria bacterium]|nr:outer membrane beta-barrel protein [Candidatus Krumholzibacteria bacterium]